MSEKLLIKNCILMGSETACSILIEDGRICEVGAIEKPDDCHNVLDAGGLTATPGLLDIHIQGAGGCDVLDATEEALVEISKASARYGVTGFHATTVYKPDGDNRHLAVAADCVGKDLGGAELLGIHLEGPFISTDKRGMIQPDSICLTTNETLDKILADCKGKLNMMTIAPELPGCHELIGRLVDEGVVAAFGHSMASYEQTLAGFDAGISHVTHLFNAMPSIHHRSPGPLPAILQNQKITVELITDGVHLHPAVLKLVFDIFGTDRIVTITDGMQALGLGDGEYEYNGLPYNAKDGTAWYEDGTLIGTATGLSDLLQRMIKFTGCDFNNAIRTATENPAKVLGIQDRKGSIEQGKDADIILLDNKGTVQMTMVAGRIVYKP